MPAEDKAYMECLIKKALNRKENNIANLQNAPKETKKKIRTKSLRKIK